MDTALNDVETGVTGLWIDTVNNIYADNANSVAITDTGRIGIGTTAPGSELEVVGDITVGDDDWIGI